MREHALETLMYYVCSEFDRWWVHDQWTNAECLYYVQIYKCIVGYMYSNAGYYVRQCSASCTVSKTHDIVMNTCTIHHMSMITNWL